MTTAGRTQNRRHLRQKPKSSLLTVLLWVAVAYFVLPLIWIAFAATKTNSGLFNSFGLWFGDDFALFSNIAELFAMRDGIFLQWGLNTILYAVTAGVGATVISTLAGYALAKFEFPGKTLLFSTTLGAIMIPLTALAIPTYLIFSVFGITNTPWAVVLPSLVSPFGVYLMRVYAADAIPDSLIEAARVDGASELRILVQVCGRLLAPGAVTVLLFTIVATWNNYFLPLIMIKTSGLYPLTVGLAQLQAQSFGGSGGNAVTFSTVITGAFVSIVPLVVAFLFLQRYWQSGLAAGSVKD